MKKITIYFTDEEEERLYQKILELAHEEKRSLSKQIIILLKEVIGQ